MSTTPIEFGDKLLHVRYSRGTKLLDVLLQKCRLEMQGGRAFLLGQWLRSDRDAWNNGLAVAIAWDRVSDYLIYESEQEYRVRRKRYRDTHNEQDTRRTKR
jgi:hypothetical protein